MKTSAVSVTLSSLISVISICEEN